MISVREIDLGVFEPLEDAPENGADPRAVLHATICLGGYPMHVWAIAVVECEDGAEQALNPDYEDDLIVAYGLMGGASGNFQTLRHEGLDYILIAVPHS